MGRAELERCLAEYFERRDDIAAVYLFGSHATGRAGPGSDVDVGLLYGQKPPRTLLGRPYRDEEALARRLGKPVQIVVMNEASADLVHRILRDGSLLVDKDRSFRIRFEVDSRNRYFDLGPIRERYRRNVA